MLRRLFRPSRPLVAPVLAVAIAFSAPVPLLAQGLTGPELWSGWKEAAKAVGGHVSASERREGNRLILSRIYLRPDAESKVSLKLDELTFTSRADGSVAITLPDQVGLELAVPPGPDGKAPERLFFTLSAPGAEVVIGGLGPRADVEAKVPSARLALDRVEPTLEALGSDPEDARDADLSVTLDGFAMNWRQEIAGDGGKAEGALNLDALRAEFTVLQNNGRKADASLDLSGIAARLLGDAPAESIALMRPDQTEPPRPQAVLDALRKGLKLIVSAEHGPARLLIDADDATGQPVLIDFSVASSTGALSIDQNGISNESSLTGARLAMKADSAGFPPGEAEMSLGEYRAGFSLGFGDLAKAQPWTLLFALRDLGLSDAIWDLADPRATIPRGPISTVLDLAGTWRLKPEVITLGLDAQEQDPMPLDTFSIALQELLLAGFGLDIRGTGEASLDFTDLTTWEGMPAPTGKLSLVTKGAYGLLDHLTALGLVPEEDLQGIRMGLLMLGKAEEGSDTVRTEASIEGSRVVLNGQRLR